MGIKTSPVLFAEPSTVRELARKQSKLLVILYFVSITQIEKKFILQNFIHSRNKESYVCLLLGFGRLKRLMNLKHKLCVNLQNILSGKLL